jgi:hypothetical protein
MVNIMQPISSYTETGLLRYRTFELYEDKISIHKHDRMSVIADLDVTLRNINPNPERLLVKDKRRDRIFLIITIIGIVLFSCLLPEYYVDYKPNYRWIILITIMVAITIIAKGFMFPRLIQCCRFTNLNNIFVFDIVRCGQMKNYYDEFLSIIISQIKKQQSTP